MVGFAKWKIWSKTEKSETSNDVKHDPSVVPQWTFVSAYILLIFPFMSCFLIYVLGFAESVLDHPLGKPCYYITYILAFLIILDFYEIPTKNRGFGIWFYVGSGFLCETLLGLLIYIFFLNNVPVVVELEFVKFGFTIVLSYALVLGAIINTIVHFSLACCAIHWNYVAYEKCLKLCSTFEAFQFIVYLVLYISSSFLVICSLTDDAMWLLNFTMFFNFAACSIAIKMLNLMFNAIPESEISTPFGVAVIVIVKSKLYRWACNIRSFLDSDRAVIINLLMIVMAKTLVQMMCILISNSEMESESDLKMHKNRMHQTIIMIWIFMFVLARDSWLTWTVRCNFVDHLLAKNPSTGKKQLVVTI